MVIGFLAGWWYTYPLKNMSSSMGRMTFHENKSHVPKHQPVIYTSLSHDVTLLYPIKTSLLMVPNQLHMYIYIGHHAICRIIKHTRKINPVPGQ